MRYDITKIGDRDMVALCARLYELRAVMIAVLAAVNVVFLLTWY